jgi:hypothetical protein
VTDYGGLNVFPRLAYQPCHPVELGHQVRLPILGLALPAEALQPSLAIGAVFQQAMQVNAVHVALLSAQSFI